MSAGEAKVKMGSRGKVFELVHWQAQEYKPLPSGGNVKPEQHSTLENPKRDVVNNRAIKTEDYRENLRPEVWPNWSYAQSMSKPEQDLLFTMRTRKYSFSRLLLFGKLIRVYDIPKTKQPRQDVPSGQVEKDGDNRPTINVISEGSQFRALLDTGASRSFLSKEAANHCQNVGIVGYVPTDVTHRVVNSKTVTFNRLYKVDLRMETTKVPL
ncbi:hypothetical protein WA026_022650 [Henosepilachna vigintioctopunctata]|uniref:Retropepsins domain-containing protein n=1 Tax=Henosepilachna vigintioctopunctata TaxID=420089 RepID=A0AAW1UCA7_9CUCU